MQWVLNAWRDKLFRFTHALILPLSVLVLASLILGFSNILMASNIQNNAVVFFHKIGSAIFEYMPFLFGAALVIYFVKLNKVYGLFVYLLSTIVFYAAQHALIIYDSDGQLLHIFYLHDSDYINYFITQSFNFKVLNTSYFGMFCVAFLTVYIMNHYSNFVLPKWLSLFNRERLVPFILLPLVVILALIILLVWPYVGLGISLLLIKMNNLHYGFNGFFYGVIKTSLKPFGFHYIFSAMILDSSAGGVIKLSVLNKLGFELKILATKEFEKIIEIFSNFTKNFKEQIFGQQNILSFIYYIPFSELPIDDKGNMMPIFQWFNQYLNIGIGNLTQNYSDFLGIYPAITIALICFSPKEKRKQLCSTMIPSLFVAIFTGISEPFEFIILFAVPSFYFLLYVPLSGLSLLIPQIFNVHIGGSINNGIIDYVVQGLIPWNKGTNGWIILPWSAIQGVIVFITFYLIIKNYNFQKINHIDYNAIYFNKKEYNDLINLGFIKRKDSKSEIFSLKKQLQNYILTNIQNGNWKPGEVLPSEKALAIKFNCSRLTARNALLKYVESGLLTSKRGQGYFVNNNTEKFIENENLTQSYQQQMVKLVPANDIDFLPALLKNIVEYEEQKINLEKTHNIEKKYFDKKGYLKIYEIAILNRSEIGFINNGIQLDNSWLETLSLKGINLTRNYSKVIFSNHQKYQSIAKELGWADDYPLIISVLNKDEQWIEISCKILSKDDWEFSRDYKVIS